MLVIENIKYMTLSAVEFSGVTKKFRDKTAISDLSFEIPEGSIFGFLGANGAGKTTAMRILLGISRSTSGSVRVFGHDVVKSRVSAAQEIGAVIDPPGIYQRLTGRENLEIARLLLGWSKSDVDRNLEMVGLSDAAETIVSNYSQGMRQRLAIARALLGGSRLLVLDEPTNGLDPEGIIDFRNLMRRLQTQYGTTIFLSSHLLSEIEAVASHVAIIEKGRLVAHGGLSELKARVSVIAKISVDNARAAVTVLPPSLGDFKICDEQTFELGISAAGNVRDVLKQCNQALVTRGHVPYSIQIFEPNLETLYMSFGRGEVAV